MTLQNIGSNCQSHVAISCCCSVLHSGKDHATNYMIMIIHNLQIYASMKHSLLLLKTFSTCAQLFRHPVCVRIKVFMLLFKLRYCLSQTQAQLDWCFFYCKLFLIKIISFSFNNIIVIIVDIAFKSSVLSNKLDLKHHFTI